MILLCAFLALAQGAAPIERKGAHFQVVSGLEVEACADEVLKVAEAAWPLALAALDLKDKKLAGPLVVHLHPDAASYEAAEQPLTGGKFKANLAFTHFDTRSVHVALQPPSTPAALKEFGLPSLTGYLVAHEVFHLAAGVHLENARDHFEWFAEGLAVQVGLDTMVALGRMRPGGAEPLAGRYDALCQDLLAHDKLPTAGEILTAETGNLDFYPRYAMNARFVALLRADYAKDFAKTVKAVKAQKPGESFRAGLVSELGKIWSEKELAKLQKAWVGAVEDARPQWDERLRSLETRGEGYLQRAWPDSNAVAFRCEELATLPITAAGTLRCLPAQTNQMNFLLGGNEKGFLSVAFVFGLNVTLFRCDYGETDTWTILGTNGCGELRSGADVPFRIEASTDELVVFVKDKEALRAKLQGRSPLGRWGLGALAGSAGEWKALAVRCGPPPKPGAKG